MKPHTKCNNSTGYLNLFQIQFYINCKKTNSDALNKKAVYKYKTIF